MKNFLVLGVMLLGVMLFTNCDITERKCIGICEDYAENFQNYLLYKYDTRHFSYNNEITPPENWLKVKYYYPEMYNEYIVPVKVLWDSLSKIPIEVVRYEGLSDEAIKMKLKIKQIESIKGKMKKSDNSIMEIGNDTYYYLDSVK